MTSSSATTTFGAYQSSLIESQNLLFYFTLHTDALNVNFTNSSTFENLPSMISTYPPAFDNDF